MAEIRAGGLSQTVHERWEELKDHLGATTSAAAMETMVNMLHSQYVSSRRVDIFRKAARLVSANEGLMRALHQSEVSRVSIQKGVVLVWARHQGEPYKISEDVWDEC